MSDPRSEPDRVFELPPDEPPPDDVWVDGEVLLGELSDEELEKGRELGESIDPDDDLDSGLPTDQGGRS